MTTNERPCRTKVITVRRRFSKLDKALMCFIGVLVVLTLVLARTTLKLAYDTMDLSDQMSDMANSSNLTIARLEERVAVLEAELNHHDKQITVVSATEFTDDSPRTLEYVDCGLSNDILNHAYQMSIKYDVPFSALLAVMDRESGFGADIDHTNTNGSTDIGIMQINSCNWDSLKERYGLDVCNSDYDNIEAGALFLGTYWSKYTPEEAFAAYNMGEGGMNKYGVNDYGREVNQMYLNYETILGG